MRRARAKLSEVSGLKEAWLTLRQLFKGLSALRANAHSASGGSHHASPPLVTSVYGEATGAALRAASPVSTPPPTAPPYPLHPLHRLAWSKDKGQLCEVG